MARLAVVMPVGPEIPVDSVRDTLDSITAWCGPDTVTVMVDDSGTGLCEDFRGEAGVEVVTVPGGPSGITGGLMLAVGLGFEAAQRHDPEVVLRLDVDALVVGPRPEDDALQFFANQPHVGLLGSYRVGVTGAMRSFAWAGRTLREESRLRGRRGDALRRAVLLRSLELRARRRRYEPGAHALAAACFLSRPCLDALLRSGWLREESLRASQLGDDHLLGLLVPAAGYLMADFAPDPFPIGVAWKGLPMPPEELLRRGKKLVHSVKSHGDQDEATVRAFFAEHRAAMAGAEPLRRM